MSTDSHAPPNDHPAKPDSPPSRIASVDTYRGAVMFLMMAEVLDLSKVAKAFPDSVIWQWLSFHQSHVEWGGWHSVHDMIQPSFSFLVGVALPFSLASRLRRGESLRWATLHAAWRSLILIALGIFLRSIGRKMTNYTFEDTLTQIGLGYLPLFLIGLARPSVRWIALGVILVGYWLAFAAYTPPADFDSTTVGVSPEWPHLAKGFASHWNKNSNLAWAFDRWFLNLFPREKPFSHNGGGYATLSFIPTLGTMLLGLIAGGWIQGQGTPGGKLGRLILAGVVGVAFGLALDHLGVCPIVKRIWTPSWVLFSGGICFATLGILYALIDLTGYAGWTYPLRVIGRNSIAAYCLAHLIDDFIRSSYRTHLGKDIFDRWGGAYEPLVAGAAVLAVYWLILFWMDRRRIYLKV
jgi:heparan-alpha-glucosaminide N-acetyltransferase